MATVRYLWYSTLIGEEIGLLRLASYAWPGNIRELQNVIERAIAIGHGTSLPRCCGVRSPGFGRQGARTSRAHRVTGPCPG